VTAAAGSAEQIPKSALATRPASAISTKDTHRAKILRHQLGGKRVNVELPISVSGLGEGQAKADSASRVCTKISSRTRTIADRGVTWNDSFVFRYI
jgi:seryl-tRNA(Sec) selenium transferase